MANQVSLKETAIKFTHQYQDAVDMDIIHLLANAFVQGAKYQARLIGEMTYVERGDHISQELLSYSYNLLEAIRKSAQ